MDECSARVWPRLEPFLLGALQVAPPSKLSLHYLRKMATYVRTRDGCFPHLGWPMWRHIACGKLQLSEELAWLYLETFDLLRPHTPGQRLEWAEGLSQCATPRELDRMRSRLSVNTLQFLLFLHMQQFNRMSLRTSLIGEEWPSSRSTSPSSSSERETKASSPSKNWDDQAHMTFIQSHLAELLELLVEPGQLSASGQVVQDSHLSQDALQGLGFLLEGSLGQGGAVRPLHRLLAHDAVRVQAGYSKLSRSFSLRRLQAWLHRALSLNPFGVSACLRSGKKLAWVQQVEGAMRRARIARNTPAAPPGSKVVVMAQVFRQTLAKDSEKLKGANVKVHRCSEAFIYLLSPLRSVSLDKCRNSTVVLGPVEIGVHVQNCENVRLVCVTGRLTVGSSSSCTFHILTPTRPLLLPGNVALVLAPFHTHYPSLEDHMASVGLAVVPNAWDRPLLLGAEGAAPDRTPYRLLPPAELCPLVVPFKMEGDTCEVPGGLPPLYQQALECREQRLQDWLKMVKDADLNKEQRRTFQTLVEHKFHEWLLESGNRQQLDSLVPSSEDASTYTGGPDAGRPDRREAVMRMPTAC
ncbi:TBCC domain-containing protein 1-like [Scleropages formosus]|uniref:TBCC domain-containing protein 1 n=1 Tax=Scleropages formosus TaxID=113540 RepID=A0A0N8JWW4_SCLFO|nr:TBCC domain-containing protein 1-like [Scleropages formosus]